MDRRDVELDKFFDWLHGKWLDGFAILGPAVVTPDEIPDVRSLAVETRVSGAVRVAGNTGNMIFGFPEIVSFASRLMELHPGDVIATGMPHQEGPEIPLEPGDVVEGQIDHLGVLRNPVIAEA